MRSISVLARISLVAAMGTSSLVAYGMETDERILVAENSQGYLYKFKFRHSGAGRNPAVYLKCFLVSALHCLFDLLDTGLRR